ncbi:MAG TPA: hypothetical protein VN282_18130 [Pyrinomonadaceae bacterium]|nr:hypothetical protein [Pyrinomonadaceae bacterium]
MSTPYYNYATADRPTPALVAPGVTAATAVVGPPLAVVLMKVIF